MQHIKPVNYFYKGGYTSTTICTACGKIRIYVDQHPDGPCNYCGGKIKNNCAMWWSDKDSCWHSTGTPENYRKPPKPKEEVVKLKRKVSPDISIERLQIVIFVFCMLSFIMCFVLGKIST